MVRGGLAGLVAAVALSPAVSQDGSLLIDSSQGGATFDGIGALSGGGATTRLLVDYPEPQRSQVLDYLFTPNYGASLHILKVEIGGDSQSTDGSEPSHMHSADDLDYKRGYEWWLLSEAKKRNPDIKTYGLPWAYPGWVGGPEQSGSPFTHPELTSKYILNWLQGAREVYGVEIDYMGVWNERASNAEYVKTLRQVLNSNNFTKTQLVAKDGDADICNDLVHDAEYQAAVSIVGLHYPSDYSDYSTCRQAGYGLYDGKPMWASEESSSYDDLNGAACWARVITSHWVLQNITSSIMWNLVGSYMHGTDWYASSLMTAAQPWSGHFNLPPVLWATAHVTQFTKVGWKLLKTGTGSGNLPGGGFYATYADPAGSDWTLTVVKISEDHAPCTRPGLPAFSVAAENVTFTLAPGMKHDRLAVWYSNFEEFSPDGTVPSVFQRLVDLQPVDGSFTLEVKVGAFYTVSTILDGPTKGEPKTPIPASQPMVPLPLEDDFESYETSQEAKWWTDQIGIFEVHHESSGNPKKVMRQMVPELPIGWSDPGSNGPVTLIGMREWQDISITASFKLPVGSEAKDAACVGSRVDQMWQNGIVLCISAAGNWSLLVGGPGLKGISPNQVLANGTAAAPPTGRFSNLTLSTVGANAYGSIAPCGAEAPCDLFKGLHIRTLDTGFAAMGASTWIPIEFSGVRIEKVGPRWRAPQSCMGAAAGTLVAATKCATNGFALQEQTFDLLASWGIRHVPSGLCVAAKAAQGGSQLHLAPCDPTDARQQFRNDYTNVRNRPVPFTVTENLIMSGSTDGTVSLSQTESALGDVVAGVESALESIEGETEAGTWGSWVYFPNTKQLRNQYTADINLGYPLCLSACPSVRDGQTEVDSFAVQV